MGFIGQHAVAGAAAALAFLAPDFFNPRPFGRDLAGFERLDFIQQQATREKAVESLLARALAFDLDPCRPVENHDAGGGFIHVLAAVTARADESLLQISFADLQSSHSAT